LLGERPGQHKFGFEDRSRGPDDAVKSCRHPRNGRMLDLALDVGDVPAGVALVPSPVELLGGGPKLYDEIARQILRRGFATFLPPEANQGGFISAHDDPGVRAADEGASADGIS